MQKCYQSKCDFGASLALAQKRCYVFPAAENAQRMVLVSYDSNSTLVWFHVTAGEVKFCLAQTFNSINNSFFRDL